MTASGDGKKAIVYGWSQGGGATIAAASLPDYVARRERVRQHRAGGFVALAPFDTAVLAAGMATTRPPRKAMAELTASFSDNVFNFTHFAMNMWGMQAAFPDSVSMTFSPTTARKSWTGSSRTNACMRRRTR